MQEIKTDETQPFELSGETKTLYRFRIWKDSNGFYSYDDDIYLQEVPEEMIEVFHIEDEVYTMFADTGEDVDNTSGANGRILLVLSDNQEKISEYVKGIFLAVGLDKHFDSVE